MILDRGVPFETRNLDLEEPRQDHWLSYSDLFAGLLMVFTLMLLATLRVIGGAIDGPLGGMGGLGGALGEADFDSTEVIVDDSLGIITFPEGVLFEQGSAVVSDNGKEILQRFSQTFSEHLFKDSESRNIDWVESIVVEGHTNSAWDGIGDPYRENLRLSQERAFAVMEILIAASGEYSRSLQRYLTASGRSFSNLKCRDGQTDKETSIDPLRRCGQHGGEDRVASRRIEMRFLTTGKALAEALPLFGQGRPDNPVEESPPPPEEQVVDISAAPTFTPFTVAPDIQNRAEVIRALEREYPPLLRDAGVGGTVQVYFFIDEEGTVQKFQINESSGYQALDDAALAVAGVYRFSAALNRDNRVPVWVSFPITFLVR